MIGHGRTEESPGLIAAFERAQAPSMWTLGRPRDQDRGAREPDRLAEGIGNTFVSGLVVGIVS
jgi:hypothetical protein